MLDRRGRGDPRDGGRRITENDQYVTTLGETIRPGNIATVTRQFPDLHPPHFDSRKRRNFPRIDESVDRWQENLGTGLIRHIGDVTARELAD